MRGRDKRTDGGGMNTGPRTIIPSTTTARISRLLNSEMFAVPFLADAPSQVLPRKYPQF